ncbi:MAG: 50S ribosomal protein L44e [Candidatus Woesearchaeota archaeon]
MKVPKKVRKYCPKCKKHTEMAVSISKQMGKNAVHTMTKGSRQRMRLRGEDRGFGNKGKTSKGAMNKWKRYGAKKSKKLNLTLRCKECKKAILLIGSRTKRVEVVSQ